MADSTLGDQANPDLAEGTIAASGTFLKLVPEGMTAHWRFGWAAPNLPTFSVPLKEVRVVLNDAGDTLTGLELSFVCSAEVYAEIESWGWFGLEQTQSDQMGVSFDPERPVRVDVALEQDYLGSVLTEPPDPEDPEATLARLLAPLLDPQKDGTIHMPTVFRWQRVAQDTHTGTVGFTHAGRIVDLGAQDDIVAPAKAQDDATTIENVRVEEPEQVHWVEPMVPGTLSLGEGWPPLEPILERVRYLVSPSGSGRLEATFQLPYEDYLAAQFQGAMGISADAMAGQEFTEFEESLPVHVDARLDDALCQEVVDSEKGDPEQVVLRVARAIAGETSDDRLRNADAWTFLAVLQQPEGTGFRVGYHNRHLK